MTGAGTRKVLLQTIHKVFQQESSEFIFTYFPTTHIKKKTSNFALFLKTKCSNHIASHACALNAYEILIFSFKSTLIIA